MLKVVLLGRLAELAGWREREFEAVKTLSDLVLSLGRLDPDLGPALSALGVRAAVNQIISAGDAPLQAGDEVAFLPIYSGG